MRFTHAICRRPAPNFADGLTTVDEGRPDHDRACAQHAAYVQALEDLGVRVEVLDPLDDFPDAHFVEDVAVISPAGIVLTRPGAPERRGEVHAIVDAVAAFGPVIHLEEPATLDGGDVLRVGSTFFVGRSKRTNAAGAAAFAKIVRDQGLQCEEIEVGAGLHLKSGVNVLDDETVVCTPSFADAFARLRLIVVDATEAYAACALRINDGVIVPDGYPRAREAIEEYGLSTVTVDVGEFRKMDGGLTCLSLRFGESR